MFEWLINPWTDEGNLQTNLWTIIGRLGSNSSLAWYQSYCTNSLKGACRCDTWCTKDFAFDLMSPLPPEHSAREPPDPEPPTRWCRQTTCFNSSRSKPQLCSLSFRLASAIFFFFFSFFQTTPYAVDVVLQAIFRLCNFHYTHCTFHPEVHIPKWTFVCKISMGKKLFWKWSLKKKADIYMAKWLWNEINWFSQRDLFNFLSVWICIVGFSWVSKF